MPEEQQPPQEEKAKPVDTAETQGDAVETPHEASEPPKKEEEIDEMTNLHERTIAALSYFGFLAIVPFYLKKESKFCRYHGKQGMTLAIIFFLLKFVSVLDLIMDLALILQAVIALWMGFVALSGRWKKMPVVYEWSCHLEDALSLKTKEEEEEELSLKPNQVKVEEEPAATEPPAAPESAATDEPPAEEPPAEEPPAEEPPAEEPPDQEVKS